MHNVTREFSVLKADRIDRQNSTVLSTAYHCSSFSMCFGLCSDMSVPVPVLVLVPVLPWLITLLCTHCVLCFHNDLFTYSVCSSVSLCHCKVLPIVSCIPQGCLLSVAFQFSSQLPELLGFSFK